jgi:hypothetical protein
MLVLLKGCHALASLSRVCGRCRWGKYEVAAETGRRPYDEASSSYGLNDSSAENLAMSRSA